VKTQLKEINFNLEKVIKSFHNGRARVARPREKAFFLLNDNIFLKTFLTQEHLVFERR